MKVWFVIWFLIGLAVRHVVLGAAAIALVLATLSALSGAAPDCARRMSEAHIVGICVGS